MGLGADKGAGWGGRQRNPKKEQPFASRNKVKEHLLRRRKWRRWRWRKKKKRARKLRIRMQSI